MSEKKHRDRKVVTVLYFVFAIIFIAIKAIAGFLGNSRSMIFDAVHSISSILSFSVLHHRRNRLRERYEHGLEQQVPERKMNFIYALIAISFIVISVEMIIYTFRNFGSVQESALPWTIMVIGISMIAKELFNRLFQGKFGSGDGFLAQLLSNRSRSDMLPMLIALVGTSLSVSSAWFDLSLLLYADSIAGLLIATQIAIKGFQLFFQLLQADHFESSLPADYMLINKTIEIVPGVISVSELHVKMICDRMQIRALINVSPQMTLQEAHEIAKSCKLMVQSEFSNLHDVTVHVQPYGQLYPYKTDFQERSEYSSIIH